MLKTELRLVVGNCRECLCVDPDGRCHLIKKINLEYNKRIEDNVSHHYNLRTHPDTCPLYDYDVHFSGKMYRKDGEEF